MSEVVDILKAAKLAIEDHGWTDGMLYSKNSGFCLTGALAYALGWDKDSDSGAKYSEGYRIVDTTPAAAMVREAIYEAYEDYLIKDEEELLDSQSTQEFIEKYQYEEAYVAIIEFNDSVIKTQQEAIAILDKAIEKAKETT